MGAGVAHLDLQGIFGLLVLFSRLERAYTLFRSSIIVPHYGRYGFEALGHGTFLMAIAELGKAGQRRWDRDDGVIRIDNIEGSRQYTRTNKDKWQ